MKPALKSSLPKPGGSAAGAARQLGRILFLGAWGLGTSVVVADLMASHVIPLPAGTLAAAVPKTLEQVSGSRSRWQAVHVLAEGCPCSAAVADYLVRRGPAADVNEQVWIAGDGNDLSDRLAARGFCVKRVTADELHHADGASVLGAPWLLLLNPQGKLAYSGGYAHSRPRPGVELEDLAILRQLQSGQAVEARPAFGCAVDANLQRAMDPLGLKYR